MFTPTVVFTGANSTNDQGKNYQNTEINGLTYNPANNILIATQQWGGTNGDGYINEFPANGLSPTTQYFVIHNFTGTKVSFSVNKTTSDADIRVQCYPSEASALVSTSCYEDDNAMLIGRFTPGQPFSSLGIQEYAAEMTWSFSLYLSDNKALNMIDIPSGASIASMFFVPSWSLVTGS
jgi:hypothetical protein